MLSIVDFELLTIVESLILRASEIQRWYQSPANLSPQTSSAFRHQPSYIFPLPSYILHQPSDLSHHPPSALRHQPSDIL
ncbi:hypothetical protein [Prevotella communis]|uniref:hypothetical protein n=1 Tax=Prevotella communis TaxID=2913614 RepID=UPI00115FBCFA|nr:hypothetical protein [Prevotella communis]